ncbi:MAG: hypothetical protein AAF242_04160 [Bacteroidota bacterium]
MSNLANPGLNITVHLQNRGDLHFKEGDLAGTRGQARRLEGFQVQMTDAPEGLEIEYMAHIANLGDTPWNEAGIFVGTRGKALALEGIAIRLKGPLAPKYNVKYKVHMAGIGDSRWTINGAYCGTRGQARRIEAIIVDVQPKAAFINENSAPNFSVTDGSIAGGGNQSLTEGDAEEPVLGESVELQNLDKDMKGLKVLLMDGDSTKGPLWKAWHFLQVYSAWGLRMPNTEAGLQARLGTDTSNFGFFSTMLEAYKALNETGAFFTGDVFPRVVDLGNALQTFAEDASNSDDDGIFSAINDLMDGPNEDKEAALELITDLQDQATANADEAGEIATLLGQYKARLTDVQGKLELAQDKVDSDSATSQATIDKLAGGEDIIGSILQMQSLLEDQKAEYQHDVTVAATTVTYAWVPWVGWLSGAIVAGVFGDKAVKALDAVEETEDKISKAQKELSLAVNTRGVQSVAKNGIDNALDNTDIALTQANTVQNAWNQINANLGEIRDKMVKLTSPATGDDTKVRLRHRALVERYTRQAGEKWDEILPALNDLTDDPFIILKSGVTTVEEMKNEVEAAAAA